MATRRPIDWDSVSRGEVSRAENQSGMWSWSDAPDLSGEWPAMTVEGRYVRGTVLAEGGMGAVLLAEDPLLRRQVALKVVRSGADSREAQRLLREARITAALRHPGVAGVLDAGVDGQGRPWFAMPVIPGRTLASLLYATGVTPVQSLRALAGAADILGHAHKAGIVHRDVKPSNLMVSSDGDVVVLDWGIARPESATTEWDSLLTRTDASSEELLGTPAYMSPEQVIGDDITARSDVWSLGVCLVEILDGALPFAGGDAKEVMRSVLHGPLPQLEGPLGTLVTASLSRDPERRPADGHAFAEALRAAMAPPVADEETAAAARGGVRGGRALALLVGVGVGMASLWLSLPSKQPDTLLMPALVHLARSAAMTGDRPIAELASAAALQRGDGDMAVFRGILASKTPELRPLDRTVAPDCRGQVVSPDGSAMVCMQADRVVVFDLPKMVERWAHPEALDDVVWTGDGVLGTRKDTRHGDLVLYDGRTGIAQEGVAGSARGLSLGSSSRLGRTVASNGGREFRLIDCLENKHEQLVAAYDGAGPIEEGTVLSDGAIAGFSTTGAYFWSAEMGPTTAEGRSPTLMLERQPLSPEDSPFNVAASGDGRWVLEGSLSGVVRLWDREEEGLHERVQLAPGMVHGLAISPDARWVAAVDELGHAWVWPRGQAQARMQLPGLASTVAFPSSDRLRVVGAMVETWSLPEMTLPHVLEATAGVTGIDWAGDWVAASMGNGQVRRWSTLTGQVDSVSFAVTADKVVKDVSLQESGAVLAASLQQDIHGRHIGVFWSEEELTPVDNTGCRRVVWLADAGAACMYIPPGPTVFSMDGTTYDSLRRPTVSLYDMEMATDRQTAVLIDEESNVLRLSWEGAEPALEVVLRDTSGKVVAAGGPGGAHIATSDGSSVSFYTGGDRPMRTWQAEATVVDLAVSPDGRRLAAGLRTGEVLVWEVDSDKPLARLVGHRERVSAVWFSPDSSELLTGSWDETLRLWDMSALDLPDEALVRQVEARWGRSAEEALADSSRP